MGNMLESDSSNNSDVETTPIEEKEPVKLFRTAGDGMECGIPVEPKDVGKVIHSGLTATTGNGLESGRAVGLDVSKILLLDPPLNGTREGELPFKLLEGRTKISSSTSPNQLPSRNLLIPVKPTPKDKDNLGTLNQSSSSYEKFATGGTGKQRNPKFVPYEPYSCATRPITNEGHRTHLRKSSDTSSIVSHISSLSNSDQNTPENINIAPLSDFASMSVSPSKDSNKNKTVAEQSLGNSKPHQHSTTLMKERLKMADKEINELRSENTRLKKLLVDSIAGSPLYTTSDMNRNHPIGNTHKMNESLDNLNDEIEVWRSKFLSSCVLVEQLSKSNQSLAGSLKSAAEVLQGLKNSVPLTPKQYDIIIDWFRATEPLRNAASLSFENFDEDHNLNSL